MEECLRTDEKCFPEDPPEEEILKTLRVAQARKVYWRLIRRRAEVPNGVMKLLVGRARVPRTAARAPRSRSVRSSRAKARAPDDPSPKPPPELVAVPVAVFRRDVRRWLEGAA
jgi:hypothetical protein